MRSSVDQALEAWLAEGRTRIGELSLRGRFELCHWLDAGHDDLPRFDGLAAADALARFDRAGNFRPLRSAPNLRRGWRLVLRDDLRELRAALDVFYPAMLGTLLSQGRGELEAVPLRETLNRQSGMYAVTKRITNDAANGLVGRFCRSDGGCLKTILWPIEPGVPITSLPASKFDPAFDQTGCGGKVMPLLCAEACNLLVAAARDVVKRKG